MPGTEVYLSMLQDGNVIGVPVGNGKIIPTKATWPGFVYRPEPDYIFITDVEAKTTMRFQGDEPYSEGVDPKKPYILTFFKRDDKNVYYFSLQGDITSTDYGRMIRYEKTIDYSRFRISRVQPPAPSLPTFEARSYVLNNVSEIRFKNNAVSRGLTFPRIRTRELNTPYTGVDRGCRLVPTDEPDVFAVKLNKGEPPQTTVYLFDVWFSDESNENTSGVLSEVVCVRVIDLTDDDAQLLDHQKSSFVANPILRNTVLGLYDKDKSQTYIRKRDEVDKRFDDTLSLLQSVLQRGWIRTGPQKLEHAPGELYLESQVKAMCGIHALNTLYQKEKFVERNPQPGQINVRDICRRIEEEERKIDPATEGYDCENPQGYFNIEVLRKSILAAGQEIPYDSLKTKDTEMAYSDQVRDILVNPKLKGLILNIGSRCHYITILADVTNGIYTIIDSINVRDNQYLPKNQTKGKNVKPFPKKNKYDLETFLFDKKTDIDNALVVYDTDTKPLEKTQFLLNLQHNIRILSSILQEQKILYTKEPQPITRP